MADLKDTLKGLEGRMNKTTSFIQEEFPVIRADRANPHVLDRTIIDYYDTRTPLQRIGNVSVPEARMILIRPQGKNLLKEIERVVLTSDLDVNPTNDGSVTRLLLPEFTEEHRRTLTKGVRKKGEAVKAAVRSIRHDGVDALEKIEKADEIIEDDLSDADEKPQKPTDKVVERISKAVEVRDEELMTI